MVDLASVAAPANLLHAPRKAKLANRAFVLASVCIATLILGGVLVVGILLEPAAQATDLLQKNLPPSFEHPFGTDALGRDMFVRTLAGLSLSLRVGLGGRRVDAAISWLIDLMMGIPHIVLLILIAFALGKGFWGVTLGVALTHWPSLARVVRAEVLQCKGSGFVAFAEKLGATPLQIAWRHMIPFVLPQFLVGLILLFPHAILHEAAITFLGFGLPPEQPAIGIILAESMGYLSVGMWWLAVFPGLALIAIVGSGVRRMVDPQSSQE